MLRDGDALGDWHSDKDSLKHESWGHLQAARTGPALKGRGSSANQGLLKVTPWWPKGRFYLPMALKRCWRVHRQPEEHAQREGIRCNSSISLGNLPCPQWDRAELPGGWRNACLLQDGTVRSEVEENKPFSQMDSAGQALAAGKCRAVDLVFVMHGGNYSRDLPVCRWRAGASLILAHSYLKALLCDYVDFCCFFHSSVSL